jgi:hypothetical protein
MVRVLVLALLVAWAAIASAFVPAVSAGRVPDVGGCVPVCDPRSRHLPTLQPFTRLEGAVQRYSKSH